MTLSQDGACGDCPATVAVSRGMPGHPMAVHVVHTPQCEWFERNATMGAGSTVSATDVVVAHVMRDDSGRAA